MLITIKNIIGSIRNVLGIVTDGLKMWLPFERSDVLGAEVIIDGDFSPTSPNAPNFNNWSKGSNWSISGGYATSDGSVAGNLDQTALDVNKYYKVTLDVSSMTTSTLSVRLGGTNQIGNISENGTHTFYGTADATVFRLRSAAGFDGSVDNISVKEVTQIAPDTSGNSNNATLYTGKALSFDGVNDYVDCGNIGVSLKTLAFWINLDSTTEKVLQVTSSQSVEVSSGTITLNGTWTGSTIYVDATATSTIIASSYKRVVITTTSAITVDDLELGRIGSSYGDFILSDLEIYDTAWTQADVTYDYNKPNHLVTDNPSTSIALSNLKGYWALSEGDGSIAYDSSGEGNDGTINGATYVDQQTTIPQLGMMDWSKGSNNYLNSEPTSNEGPTGNITYAAYSWDYRQFDNATVFGDNSVTRYRYGGTVSPSTETTLSAFVIMDDNSEPNVTNGGGSGDFSIVLKGTAASGTNSKTNVSGNIWRVSKTGITNSGTNLLDNNGIVKYSTQSSKGFRVVGWQLEESSSPTAYRRTNGTAVTDATLVANPNNPSQDILGNSVRLREHSLNLDGSGYAEVADDSSLDMSSGFSVDFWVKLNSIDRQFLVTKGTAVNNYASDLGFGTTIFTNKIYATVNTSVNKYQVNTTTLSASGQWVYVCVSYEDNTTNGLKLYINQDSPIETTPSGTIDETHNLVVGASFQKNEFFLSNQIDSVRFYNRPLSSEEVERNYKVGEVSHKTGSSFSDDFSGDYGN